MGTLCLLVSTDTSSQTSPFPVTEDWRLTLSWVNPRFRILSRTREGSAGPPLKMCVYIECRHLHGECGGGWERRGPQGIRDDERKSDNSVAGVLSASETDGSRYWIRKGQSVALVADNYRSFFISFTNVWIYQKYSFLDCTNSLTKWENFIFSYKITPSLLFRQ